MIKGQPSGRSKAFSNLSFSGINCFMSIGLDRNARDGKSTKTQRFKTRDAVKTIDLFI
jgi:hypothetical protein